ncbi:MAG TPA: LodA/GoxA family CTQ-dependent oxidase [Bryobacteraceae bacterium]|nr:LodA/GoxA family CTQ-dependent oxidase [Bryobacteraceae bacterium]
MSNSPTETTTNAAQPADQEIVSYKIHPGLGIARVGNSPAEFYVGPLAPGEVPDPDGGFKDKAGRIKRQAAEFRVYGYNKDGVAVKEITADDAEIIWNVHLANRKAEHHQFAGRWWQSQYPEWYKENPDQPPLRNQELLDPVERAQKLVVDPGPREIKGRGMKGAEFVFDTGTFGPLPFTVVSLGGAEDSTQSTAYRIKGSRTGNINKIYTNPANDPGPEVAKLWAEYPNQVIPPVALSPKVRVPLGELQTDEDGRLRVLGGLGHSDSVIPSNEIGFLCVGNYYANNDYWYDDTSDGPVKATVVPKNGGPAMQAESAWVLVAPPKYPVAARVLTSLYDIAEETWEKKKGGPAADKRPSFTKDIYPVLERLQQYHWLNKAAFRGHGPGPGQGGYFLNAQGQPDSPLYKKGPDHSGRKKRIFGRLRPPGLLGDPTPTTADTPESLKWASALYMPQMSGDGGDTAVPQDNAPQSPEGVTGSFYVTWLTLSATQYDHFKKWADDDFDDDWTGSAPPVLPIWKYPVSEQPAMIDKGALDPCVGGAFYPGIEITYIATYPETWSGLCRLEASKFRPGDITRWMALPWQADFSECNTNWWPAARPDDVVPEAEYHQIVANYSEALEGGLEAVLANRVPWARGIPDESPQLDNAMVHAWKDFGFIVPKKYPRDGPDAQNVYIEVDRSPYAAVSIRDAFYYLMNISSFEGFLPKAQAMIEGMLKEAWRNQEMMMADADQVWKYFPFTQDAFDARMQLIYDNFVRDNNSADGFATDLRQTRAQVINTILQIGPFNQLDGAWLSRVTPDGPLDTINELLFHIRMDELGDGVESQNHANVYTATMESVNLYLPDLHTRAYADYPGLLDSAFVLPVFLLGIAQFNDLFFPELLGMTLELEWGSISLPRTVRQLSAFGITPQYYKLHVGIDNASEGHGAIAKKAIEMYLEIVRQQNGEHAMQEVWKRIWTGYVAFGTLGTLGADLAELPPEQDQGASKLWNDMAAMIASKQQYASLMHGDIKIGENRLNDWFEDPFGLMVALQQAGFIVPGNLDSPMFQLMSFDGPMYKVFTDEQIELWQRWVLSLTETKGKAPAQARDPKKRRSARMMVYDNMRIVVDMLRARQQGASGHRARIQGPDPDNPSQKVTKPLHWWFNLGTNLVGDNLPEQLRKADDLLLAALSDPANGWIVKGNILQSPLVTSMATGWGDMAEAFREHAPGAACDPKDYPDGITYLACLVNWIQAGCPIGEAEQKAIALAVAAEPEPEPRKRRHPWGMGKVH